MRKLILLVTHAAALGVGGALGIYLLPILTAPASPDAQTLQEMARGASYRAQFSRDLKGSDFLHWGEGTVAVSPQRIVHMGALAPGPDYKLYLVPDFAADEAEFLAQKAQSARVGDVSGFGGAILDIPAGIDIEAYTTVVIWCEAVGEFITAAKYR
ncbi:DM13 domain-containing protein [Thalassobius sp. S69A]|uniref:DM13 domain-containing protein n=1 Tax=unclassified Thalassovita TaxID=2619711 RepID=UPI000C0E84D2|nr:hypothetical protein [Paracoccaceae bacterium]MBT25886.1 hypothetical protein [Paracoccaceae bacterium]